MAITAASMESQESPVGLLFKNSHGAFSRRLPDGSVIQLWKSAGWGGSWHPDPEDPPIWTTHGQDTPGKVWEDLLEWVLDCEKELREAQDKAWAARRIGNLLDSPREIPQSWWARL